MEDFLLPFRKGKREKEEKKKKVKEEISTELSLLHKAKSRMRQADLEFEKAFAEVMGLSSKEEEKEEKGKPKKPKKVRIVGRKKPKKWPVFYFWYTDAQASSLSEFKKAIKKIPNESLNHHAIQNDFSKYLGECLSKKKAEKIRELENTLKSDELREKLLEEL